MIRWEQMTFLGMTFFAKFAQACGGKGYYIKAYSDVESTIKMAMKERMPTIVEAYVVPFKPPCQNQTSEYVRNKAESFAKRHMQEEYVLHYTEIK